MNRKVLIFGNFPFNLKNEFIDTNHFALLFARNGDEVDFVTPPAYLIDFLFPIYRSRKAVLKNYLDSPIKIEERLYQHTPLAFLPMRNSLFLRSSFNLNLYTKFFTLSDVVRKEYDICIVSQGFMLLYTHIIKSRIFIYRYNDILDGFRSHPDMLKKYEENFIKTQCNLILPVNERLKKEIHTRYPQFDKTEVLPNGVDIEFYRNAPADQSLLLIKKKKIVFCGGIDFWVDSDLLYQIATRLKDIVLIIIGPAKINIDRLISLPNVIYLGAKSYLEIPPLLKACDIGIIPFKIERLTEFVEKPLKYYEYLASGLPVLSIGISKSGEKNPYVKIFRDRELLIEYADTMDIIPFEEREKIRDTVKNSDWKQIFDTLKQYINEVNNKI